MAGMQPSHRQISIKQPGEPGTQAAQDRAPASAVDAIMGKLGLAREAEEPEANEDKLTHGLTDPSWAVRVATVQKLGSLGKAAPLELLLVALRDEQSSVRAAAARALSRNPREAAIPALTAILTDTAWVVRAEAVRALGKMPKLDSLEPLLAATHDTNAEVRSAALVALSSMGAEEAMEPLNAALQDEDWSVRETAVLTLGQLAELAVIPSLLNARLDSDTSVREAAEVGLQQIYPEIVSSPPPPSDSFAEWLQRIESPSTKTLVSTQLRSAAFNASTQQTRSARAGAGKQHKNGSISARWTHKVARLTEGLVAALILTVLLFAWLTIEGRPRAALTGQSNTPTFTTYHGHSSSVGKLAWSPDGLSIASADSRGTVEVWQASTGRTLASYTQKGAILALTWSDASTVLVAYGLQSKMLQVQEINIGPLPHLQTIFQLFNLPGTAETAAWSPGGSTLAFEAGNGEIQLWTVDATERQYLATLPGNRVPLGELLWSPDGNQLAAVSRHGKLEAWNINTKQQIPFLVSKPQITNATWIFCRRYGNGLAFSNARGEIMEWWPGTESPKLSLFISAQMYNLADSSHLTVSALGLSPGGDQLLLATSDGLVQARDAMSSNLVDVYTGHGAQVNAIAWSPDGRYIATASADTTVQVWQEP